MAGGKDMHLSASAGVTLAEGYEGGPSMSQTTTPGLPVDYCIFCFHGEDILRPDNTSLLSKFVSERGAILPKRFTHCCIRHQRSLTSVIKRARNLYLIPIHSKLHPKARFSSFSPPKPLGHNNAVQASHGPLKGFSPDLFSVKLAGGEEGGEIK